MPKRQHTLESALLTQGQQLRALAWGLLADEHGAEDVLQETWLAARTNPTTRGRPIVSAGRWLKRAVVNRARDRERSRLSRAYHEGRAARADGLPGADESAAAREVWQRVTDAVSELDEPFKSVIMMRFFQDLAPRFIAEQRGVPLATVKSQLNRGLEKLRDRLDELAGGDRGAWAGVLAGGLRGGRLGSVAIAGVALGVVALVSLAGFFLTGSHGLGPGKQRSLAGLAQSIPSEFDGSGGDAILPGEKQVGGEIPLGERQLMNSGLAKASQQSMTAPKDFGLNIQVVDQKDVPVAKAEILLTPLGHPVFSAGFAGGHGKLQLRWPSNDGAPQEFALAVRHRGVLLSGLQKVQLKAGEIRDMRLSMRHSTFERPPSTEQPEPPGSGFGKRIRMHAPQSPVVPASLEGLGGIEFRWSVPTDERAANGKMDRSTAPRLEQAVAVESPGGWTCPIEEMEQHMFTYTGTVLRANGEPADETMVLSWNDDQYFGAFHTFPDGHFYYSESPTSDTWLRAGGGPFGLASVFVPVDPNNKTNRFVWNPILDRGNEITGKIFIGGQLAPGNWSVDAEFEDSRSFHGDFNPAPNGEISIPNLPAGPGRLVLMTAGSSPLAIRVQATHSPSSNNDFDLRKEDLRSVPVEVLVVDPRGRPCQADVQLWQVSSGRGVWLSFDQASGWHRRSAIPLGSYRIRVGDPSHGYMEYGEFNAHGSETLSIGPLKLQAPGQIRFASNGPQADLDGGWRWQLDRLQAGLRTSMFVGPRPTNDTLQVPAGHYSLRLSKLELALPPILIRVPPGGVVEVALSIPPGSGS